MVNIIITSPQNLEIKALLPFLATGLFSYIKVHFLGILVLNQSGNCDYD